MAARRGDTLLFPTPPVVAAHAAIGGKKEGEGPLAACFDELSADNLFGQSNWEAAEKEMALRAARLCLKKAETTPDNVSLALAGDLQAQCTASSYALRELGIPFAGLFGACSTMAEALGLGAALCSAGMADGLLAMTSSHFCAAERQFRTPLSYGAVRTPTAQWTATAAGACLLRLRPLRAYPAPPREGNAEAGALYRHRRADEPDDLFAEGDHPGHRPSRGAAQPAAEGGKRMNYFWAFVVGGGICVIGQLLIDLTGLTPARILTGYVVAGVILSAVGWYGPLAEFAGCGATVPLLGFGHLLAKGVKTAIEEEGAIGILTGGLTAAAAGITTSLVCGVVCSWVGKSHDQN